jgi:hypothetical protein
VPPEADRPVFLSGVWCHASPAADKVRGCNPARATPGQPWQFRQAPSTPDGFAFCVKKDRALDKDQENSGATFNWQKSFQPRPRDPDIQAFIRPLCVE